MFKKLSFDNNFSGSQITMAPPTPPPHDQLDRERIEQRMKKGSKTDIGKGTDRILLRLKEKSKERREERERKQALLPNGPVNANPPTFGSRDSLAVLFSNSFGFSQGVVLGNIMKVAGIGGWDKDGLLHLDVSDQIGQACDNVAATLATLRSFAGWDYVYQVKTYHTSFGESLELTLAHLQARMQKHRPVLTCVEVQNLKLPGMVVEFEVEAYLERQDGAL